MNRFVYVFSKIRDMPGKQTKVEKLGLAREVEKLVAEGKSGRQIAAQIRADHPDKEISDSAIGRFVSQLREKAANQAGEILSKHVDKVIPDDLKALEEMEGQCLEWARESGKDRVERMAAAFAEIHGRLDSWRFMLLEERSKEDQMVVVRKIVKECLEIMAREDRLQIQRDKAMNTAIKIIDLKLRQAGLLDEEGKSPINIVDRRGSAVPDVKKGHKPFVIPGGKQSG